MIGHYHDAIDDDDDDDDDDEEGGIKNIYHDNARGGRGSDWRASSGHHRPNVFLGKGVEFITGDDHVDGGLLHHSIIINYSVDALSVEAAKTAQSTINITEASTTLSRIDDSWS